MHKVFLRITSIIICITFVISSLSGAVFAYTNTNDTGVNIENRTGASAECPDYSDYLKNNPDNPVSSEGIYKEASDYSSISLQDNFTAVEEYEGKQNLLLCQEGEKSVAYDFDIKEKGYYSIKLTFFPISSDNSRIETMVAINNKIPFSQASALYLYNNYISEYENFKKNASGDEYAPRRVISKTWTDCTLTNPDNDYDGALKFYMEKGKNTVSFNFAKEGCFVLASIALQPIAKPQSYKEYIGKNTETHGDTSIKIEAEKISLQSDSTVIPTVDQSDPLCSPRSVTDLKINVIGTSWGKHGQWLQWDFDVKKTGWYNLSVRYKQNSLKGLNVKRSMYLDGEIPFEEAGAISFPYTSSWKYNTLSSEDNNPYCFYLTEGKHSIKFEVILGELAEVIREVDRIVYDMNTAYRSVIMVTSANADKFRDYQIDKELPDLLPQITQCADRLEKCNRAVEKLANGSSADSAILLTTASQMKDMAANPDTIPYRLASWEGNIGSISSWTLSIREQPLQLDYMVFTTKDSKLTSGKANIFQKAINSVQRFFVSFAKDYNSIDFDEDGQKALTVWIGTGRDQAETIWQMANDMFTPQTDIKVNVKLVSATMIEAFLSGQAPDVSVQAARDIPVNLAVRGALLNLSAFEGFKEVNGWFTDDALIPYTMQDCVYGLPDSQSFNMLFYRTDVFEELDLAVPQTWAEFVNVANQLHLNQLDTGIPIDTDTSMFYTLLQQNGGKVFSDDYSVTLLDKSIAISSFNQWTDLFTEVGLPLSYNFFNRFRSGEMPLAIAPYINYNQLISAAPEIRNLWEMTCIPGTPDSEGNIKRSESATGTAAIILSSTKNAEEAWQFVKWWVGDAAQTRYAQDIESRVGTIGRVASANIKALEALDYPSKCKENLLKQRSYINEIPQVPGNYYLDRDLLNAFRDVVYNSRNAKESIVDYSNRINSEIQRKRKELGLE